jgi:hypothetical protein
MPMLALVSSMPMPSYAKQDRQNVADRTEQAKRDRSKGTCRTKRDSLSTLASISGLQYMAKVVQGMAMLPGEEGVGQKRLGVGVLR